MFFIPNRALKQDNKTKISHKVAFDLKNNEAAQSVYFCERTSGHSYFLTDETGTAPGRVFEHLWETLRSGRVKDVATDSARTLQL